jgi:glycosidase
MQMGASLPASNLSWVRDSLDEGDGMGRLVACLGVVLLALSHAGAQPAPAGPGPTFTFGSALLALRFDTSTGAWVGLTDRRSGRDLLGFCPVRTPVDFQADGKMICSETASPIPSSDGRWSRCNMQLQERAQTGNTLRVVSRAGDWLVTATYELLPGAPAIRRTAALKYAGAGHPRLGSVQWLVPGVRIGDPADCEIRGPQFDSPVTPFRGPGARALQPGAWHEDDEPNGGAWSAVYNRRLRMAVVCSFIARTEAYAGWAREGRDEATLGSTLWTTDLARPGQEYDLGTQYVALRRGGWPECLTAVRDMYRLHGFVARPGAPEWARHAIIYTMYPGGTMESGLKDTGGFRNVQRWTLPRIRRLGVNTLWFLPICPGLYGPSDYYAVEPAIGTESDLRNCVAAAKRDGIRVLLDLVPHGPATSSPIKNEHPDWIAKDEAGKPALWWGCWYCDYANPGWEGYMAALARHFVEQDGIKGWRVDCAAGGPPNWDAQRKVRASMSGLYGGLEVLRAAKASIRQADGETVLLPEASGPMMLEHSDIVYDYPMYWLLKQFISAESPEAWRRKMSWWLEQQRLSWPDNACFGLMRFVENHDQVRFWRQAGVGPARALMTLCAWIQGVPLYHHLQEVGSSRMFERVNALRRQVDELNTGTARYEAAPADRPGVFTCLRESGARRALVAVNLTARDVTTTISLPADALPLAARAVAYDAWSERYLNPGGADGCAPTRLLRLPVRLAPYGPALILLRSAGRLDLPALPAGNDRVLPVAETACSVRPTHSGARVNAGPIELDISAAHAGLPSAIRLNGVDLLASIDVAEGRAKPFGPGQAARMSASAPARVECSDGACIATGVMERGRSGAARVPYRLTYRPRKPGVVEVTLSITAPYDLHRVLGSLALEMALRNVDAWGVQTIEGALEDRVERFHPVAGDYVGGWLQHATGDRLWESSTLPLDPSQGWAWARSSAAGGRIGIARPRASAALPIDNIFLRETRGAERKEPGPTLVVAWMDEKEGRDLRAGRTYSMGFDLVCAPPAPRRQSGPAIRAEGGNWVVENDRYRCVVGKSGGGVIRSFESKRTGWRAIVGSDTYTDSGFYSNAGGDGDSYGSAADWPDLEPDVRMLQAEGRLTLELTGRMRRSNWSWAFAASPPIEYRKTFRFDASDSVRCEVAVRPFAKADVRGFLAHRLLLPAMSSWTVSGRDGPVRGSPSPAGGRTWQSRSQPLRDRDAAITIAGEGGESLELSGIEMTPRPQNIFFHESRPGASLFFAWLDFDPVDVTDEWRTLTYAMRIAPDGGKR